MRLVDADELIKDIQESSKLCMFDDLASKEAYRNMVEFAIYSIEDAETVYDNDRLKELADADKEGRCIILSEIKDIEKIPKKEVVATCDIKYCLDYGEYIIGYLFKNNLSDTGYSCENDYDTMLDVTHYGMLPKIVKEGEE